MATLTKYPTANTPTTGFNGVANNPTDAYTDNTVYANFQPSKPRNDEDAHSWRGFDFSAIPSGSTINSVTVKVQEYVSASNSLGQWRVALFEDVTSAGALAPGVTTAIGATQYTRATTDTSEFEWDLGTLSTEPTLAQLQATNFGVRIEAAHGNTGTSYTYYVDTIEITVDYTAPAATPTIEQKAFRFRDDSVALNTDTWTYALNTDLTGISLDSGDVVLRLRVLLENDDTTTAMPSTGDYQLQYRVNAGTWYAIGAGTGVDTALSSNYADGDATTQLLGSGSFATGDGVEGSSDALNRACATSTEIEHEWALTLTASELGNGDAIDFRVVWRQDVEAWNAPDTVTQTPSIAVTKTEGLAQQAYRIRSDALVALNATTGWAAAEDTAANINIEEPFRVRFSIEEVGSVSGATAFKFQYRHDDGGGFGSWADLVFADDSGIPARNIRAVELVATTGFTGWSDTTYADNAYANDAATTKQLAYTGAGSFTAGYGIEGANDTPSKSYDGNYSEHEILCIIHRFWSATDAGTDINEVGVGDEFEFRIVESDDTVLTYNKTPSVMVTDADKFIGGTYAESPHRSIVADVNGNLYTLIETMEKQALPVMMKSTDDGVSWVAMDVANAPGTADLEGFDLVIDNTNDIIHILSQGTDLRYLQFYTSAHASADTWNLTVGNEQVDASGTAAEQCAVLIHRPSNGDLVAFWTNGDPIANQLIYYSVRASDASTTQTWGSAAAVDDNSLGQAGVVAVLGENEDIHLFIVEDQGDSTQDVLYWVMDTADTFAGGTTPITGLDDGNMVKTPIGAPIKYMDGTKEVVMLPYSDSGSGYPAPLATMSFWRTSPGSQTYGTAQTKQVVSTLNGYVGGNNSRMPVFFLANRDTDVWMHWVEDDDLDNWDTLYRTLNEGEAGWGTDTSVRTLDANRRAFSMIRGVVYDDGTDDVIGWVIDNAWHRNGGTGGLEYGSYTLPSAGEEHSGAGSVSHTHSAVATGTKAASGAGDVSHTHSAVATGTKAVDGDGDIAHTHDATATGAGFETHSGAASIGHTHSALADGVAAETHSGSATIDHTHDAAATGVKAAVGDADIAQSHAAVASGAGFEPHSGSAAIGHSQDATATGVKGAEGIAAASHSHDATASGEAAEAHSGTASIAHSHSAVADGVKGGLGDADVAHSQAAVASGEKAASEGASIGHSHTAVATGTGFETHSGSGSVSHTHSVVATGTKSESADDRSGSGEITHSHSAVAVGEKAADSDASISHSHSVVASGEKAGAGAGSVDHTHDATASGVKAAAGDASAVHSHVATASGDALETRSGSASISHVSGCVATGSKGGEAQADLSHVSGVTASGYRDASGSASIAQVQAVVASGASQRASDADISHTHDVTADGTPVSGEQRAGSASIVHSHLVATEGAKGGEGTANIDAGTVGVSGEGWRSSRHSVATIELSHQMSATGSAGKTGSATITAQFILGPRGSSVPRTGRTGRHGPLSQSVANRTRGWPPFRTRYQGPGRRRF